MPTDLPPSIHMIDYVYSAGGVFYHGTVSDLDGTPKSTWTISIGDKKTRIDQPIDRDTFLYLWNGIQNFAAFKKSVVTDANAKMDFYRFQVIGSIENESGHHSMHAYLLAPFEADPQYKAWIEKLHVPFEKSGQ